MNRVVPKTTASGMPYQDLIQIGLEPGSQLTFLHPSAVTFRYYILGTQQRSSLEVRAIVGHRIACHDMDVADPEGAARHGATPSERP